MTTNNSSSHFYFCNENITVANHLINDSGLEKWQLWLPLLKPTSSQCISLCVNFKCSFNNVYRANSPFTDYYQLFQFVPLITLQE